MTTGYLVLGLLCLNTRADYTSMGGVTQYPLPRIQATIGIRIYAVTEFPIWESFIARAFNTKQAFE
jgi:hypothetical protein